MQTQKVTPTGIAVLTYVSVMVYGALLIWGIYTHPIVTLIALAVSSVVGYGIFRWETRR